MAQSIYVCNYDKDYVYVMNTYLALFNGRAPFNASFL